MTNGMSKNAQKQLFEVDGICCCKTDRIEFWASRGPSQMTHKCLMIFWPHWNHTYHPNLQGQTRLPHGRCPRRGLATQRHCWPGHLLACLVLGTCLALVRKRINSKLCKFGVCSEGFMMAWTCRLNLYKNRKHDFMFVGTRTYWGESVCWGVGGFPSTKTKLPQRDPN